jgi:hypothetical protein
VQVFAVLNLRAEHVNVSLESAAATLRIVVSKFGYYNVHLLEKTLWCIWGIPLRLPLPEQAR